MQPELPVQPAQPAEPDLDRFEQPEAAMPAPPPADIAPVQPAQPADQGNADVCSAMCDRVASCGIATKQACMPVCTPQIPALTAEQRAQFISMMGSMSCDDLTQFGSRP